MYDREDAEETESFLKSLPFAVAAAYYRSQHDIYNKFRRSCVYKKLIEIHPRRGV